MLAKECLLLAFVAAHGFPQSRPLFVMGTVERVSGNRIQISTGAQPVTLFIGERTEVWKGKVFHDSSPVEAGDSIAAQYRADASGQLVAETIFLNIVNFDAVITKVDGDRFEVLTNPNADPESAYIKEHNC